MASSEDNDDVYHPEDAVANALRTTLVLGGAGFTLASLQNVFSRSNVGFVGVFTKSGGTTATFVAAGATYGFLKSASANLREKKDHWNSTIAGFAAGAVAGMRFRTFPAILGLGTGLAVLQGSFDFMGGRLDGFIKSSEVDEFEKKEEMRKTRRRPFQETIEQIGEGRGIYGPGYRERRADRIKEAYGIDVPRT